MNLKATIFFLTGILLTSTVSAQQPYTISKAPFSTDLYDEFAPVFYGNGIVFCSDRGQAVNSQGQRVVKMYYADTVDTRSPAKLLSKDLKTKLNDGPATFNRRADTIYYSRNLVVEGNFKLLSTYRNKLGLFYAVTEDKGWSKAREIRFNTEWFNITMPCLSQDGKRLYFASDKPDGFGGMDIYYSNWKNGYWEDPVNLGPLVNTKGNETYPFINETGELFFSSDGHGGLGGKDIFVTKQRGAEWFPPVRLEAPLNSEYDDFGIVTNAIMNAGYFSSNRGKTIDIYSFRSELMQVWFSEPQKENRYCFVISDSTSIQVDTLKLQYVWDFGDNTKMNGSRAQHCFPGPGNYSVNLTINDRRTGKSFFRKLTYDLAIVDYEQPFITSPDYAVTNERVVFDGLNSYCPGYNIIGYFWDFGESTQMVGERANHTYVKEGEYEVRLGLTMKSQQTGSAVKRAVTKRVTVFRSEQEKVSFIAAKPVAKQDLVDIRQFENVKIKNQYSAEQEFRKDAIFRVELMSSRTRAALNSSFFRNVPTTYIVKEKFDDRSGLYSYFVDEQMTLMATYPAYTEMILAGYNDTSVKLYVLTDPAERELLILKKNYGILTDTYFDANNRLVTNAYLMLDQVVMLMNKFPGTKLEVGVHTDNQGTAASLMSVSQARALVIVNYLINRGISGNRLTAKGYGGTKPVSSNATWLDRRLNRRVEFSILN
jgi:outer membrane protein OmpA-like peptidoglycan-associated protein